MPAVRGQSTDRPDSPRTAFLSSADQASDEETLTGEDSDQSGPWPQLPFRYIVFIVVAIAATIIVSSAIAVVVGRSLSKPTATSSPSP